MTDSGTRTGSREGTREAPTERLVLRTSTGAPQPTFRLTVSVGPDQNKSVVVDGASPNRLLVGTGPTCHWILSDPAVSRRHLALSLRGGALGIEDLGSTNGTFVGSLRVKDVMLSGGEELAAASTRIRVERLDQDAEVDLARVAGFGRVVGASIAMRRLYPTLQSLAKSDLPVLIEGEAGTGKELVAEVLHEEGPRSQNELFVFDPRTAGSDIEAKLFGSANVPGAIELARGGTLVLDEPSELAAPTQLKLARWLDKRAIAREDGSQLGPIDVRVIALSRSDVENEIQAGRLREELAAVLAAARIELPPLRERAGDITLLATTFFRALRLEDRVLAPLTLRRFEAYSWPGNVRELKAAVVRYAATGDDEADPKLAFRGSGEETSASDLYARVLSADLPLPQARDIIIEDFDRRFVRMMLQRHGGNVTRAAAASGLARRYFQVLRVKRGV